MILFRILLLATLCSFFGCVYIENNGYKDITISFSENALDESFNLDKLKEVFSKASELLFHATRNRSYFEEFVIVVPPSWTEYDVCDENSTETPKNIDIYVTPRISVLTTQHSKGCGEKGDVIYLPKQWLTGNTDDLAFQFVQEWSTFRYGVFSENPETPGSCIATSDLRWNPTGCYNIDLDVQTQYNENGLPVCHLPDDFNDRDDLRSSIMFSGNSSKMLDFCDGSESLPHNPIAPTLHNRICEGNAVWSIIKNSTDFLYGKNLPMKEKNSSTVPIFRCFKETKTHLTIMVQNTDSEARSEIRFALYYFLSIIEPEDFSVSLATFSSDTHKDTEFINLDLQNKTSLKSILDSHVKLNQKVSSVCLTCGVLKAYEVSNHSQSPLRVIVLLSWESSLENAETSKLVDAMNKDAIAIPYFLFLDDTVSDNIPSSLEVAVQESRGQIFRVKNEPVFMLTEISTALLDTSKNVLHVEDKILVVHKKLFVNVTSDISDVFLTPPNAKGTLLYSMQCKKRGDITSINNACSDMDINLQSPVCGSEENINEDSTKDWKYSFNYIAGAKGTICSSLALLKLNSSPANSLTMRGWLNKNKIIPGRDVLIIYTEIYGISEENVQVEARISGPGLEDFRLKLRDNGNGDPDIIKGDNIYSRYFTSFPEKGTYTVSIHAEVAVAEANNKHIEGKSADSEMKITQTKLIGTFRIMQSPPKEDILPPNRVTDLRVTSINYRNRTVSLQWTAPGDDYDNGKAKKYIIKRSNNWMSLMDFTFNLKENVLLETDEYWPKNSGIIENVQIECPLSNYSATYYIALCATDGKDNRGKISNIIQIYFKAYFSLNDSTEVSTETPDEEKYQTSTLISTDMPTVNFTSPIVIDETTKTVLTNNTKDGIFIEKKTFIIAASSSGVLILVLIILNMLICYCCLKKKQQEKPKKSTRKASLQHHQNLNIAYKHGSETSLEEEHEVTNSLNTPFNSRRMYSSSDENTTLEMRYTYHTDRSLQNKMDKQKKNELGFKLVQPAYATSSLSRFAARDVNVDNETVPSHGSSSNTIQLQKLNNAEETQIYPLGLV